MRLRRITRIATRMKFGFESLDGRSGKHAVARFYEQYKEDLFISSRLVDLNKVNGCNVVQCTEVVDPGDQEID